MTIDQGPWHVKGGKSSNGSGTDKLPESEDARDQRHATREQWMREQLRQIYDEVLHEPLPADLQALLDRFEDEPAGDKASTAQASRSDKDDHAG